MKNRIQKNESGSILFSCLILSLVLCVAVFGLFSLKDFINLEQIPQHICRTNSLSVQKKVDDDLGQLLSLNKTVRHLRIVAKTALATMIIAAVTYNAPLLEYARRVLQVTRKTQRMVKGTQKFLLAQAQFQLYTGLFTTAANIEQELKRQEDLHRKWNFDQSDLTSQISNINLSFSIPRIGVGPVQSNEDPPEYELLDNFSDIQALRLIWHYNYQTGLDKGQLWTPVLLKKRSSCTATISGDQEKLEEVLIVDKY